MLTFEYTAKDSKTGDKVQAEVQAESEQAAAKLISRQGLAPLEIRVKGEGSGPLSNFKNRVRTKDRVLFSRQLSTLLNAGLPLVQSLRTVAGQAQNKGMQMVINQVITDIEAGNSFSKALSAHPKVFNQVFTSLVASGESSGTLDKALERIANQQEHDAEMISKVRGAMVYPGIVLVVIIGVTIFMLRTVLPQVGILYKDLKKTLPPMTSFLLSISNAIGKYWFIFLIVIGIIIFFINRWRETEAGRSTLDQLKMNMPLFKGMFMKLYMARFCRTGTTLIASGVPLLEMLRITGSSVNNVHIENSIKSASEKVKSGKALSDCLTDDPNFLPLVPQMLKIGETSGAMDQMLEKTATFYENELDNEIKAITTTIEPILMVVMAVMVGFIVAAILLPVYGLVNVTSLT